MNKLLFMRLKKKGAALYQATEFVDHISISVWLLLFVFCLHVKLTLRFFLF